MNHIETNQLSGDDFEFWKESAKKAREELLENWEKTGTPPQSKDFKQYIWKKLKDDFLLKIHNNKCAYCQSDISACASLHVEHFRPKCEVTVRNEQGHNSARQKISHTGYFWLAYEWENLILSCPFCNTDHSTFEEDDETNKHPGKKNEFRIDGTRINSPSKNPNDWFVELVQESPLLLHPYFDFPEEHITFDENGVPYPLNGSKRGKETIEVCNLDRLKLNEARLNARKCMYRVVDLMLEKRFDDARNELNSQSFSLWIEHCVDDFVKNMSKLKSNTK